MIATYFNHYFWMTETMVIKSVIQQVDPIASRIELPTIFFVVYNGRKSNG